MKQKPLSIAEAKRYLISKGWKFVRSEVKRWRYDWNTTYRNGDAGVASQRFYTFLTPEGKEMTIPTRSVRNMALGLACQTCSRA